MDDAQSHFGPLFVIMPVFGLVMDTCITGATWCCDDGQHQNVSLGTTRHNLGWAKRPLREKEEASNTFVLVTSMYTYNVGGTNFCTCEP